MGFWKKMCAATIETALLPVDLVKDVATLGGSVLGNDTTYTGDRLRSIGGDIESALNELKD